MDDELLPTATMVPTCNPSPRTTTSFTPSFPPFFCLQARFGGILSEAIRDTHTQLTAAKARLEAVSLDGASKDVIDGVTFIQVGTLKKFNTNTHTSHGYGCNRIQPGRQAVSREEREEGIE